MGWPHRRFWLALGAAVLLLAALIEIRVTGPRIHVRWAPFLDDASRTALEQRFSLVNGRREEGSVWRYQLGDWSRDNIGGLVRDPAIADTGYIDRNLLTAEDPSVGVGIRALPFPFSADALFPDRSRLFQPQSLCLVLAGTGLLLLARRADERLRRNLGIATLLAVALMAYVLPLSPSLLHMGDANSYTSDRSSFESYAGVMEIRYEAHLSHAILGRLDEALGRTEESPNVAFDLLMRIATAWFVASAVVIGSLERWSPLVLRYLGLVLLAPATLLYFGYRELGYLSLNVAAFPLLARGLKDGAPRLEAASVLTGLGAALHGFGLLSLAGAGLAVLATPLRLANRLQVLLRLVAWGTAAYIGWIAVYIVALGLPVTPGHADLIPWRPWLVDQEVGDRLNVAILSLTGGRDLLFTAWVVGAPLLLVVASLWRARRDDVRIALWYALPSTVFSIAFWPVQGMGQDTDLLVAAFPAFYALAWVCAHEPRRTTIAAALLISAHMGFWRVVLDERFLN